MRQSEEEKERQFGKSCFSVLAFVFKGFKIAHCTGRHTETYRHTHAHGHLHSEAQGKDISELL